jgi:hypothetical protein
VLNIRIQHVLRKAYLIMLKTFQEALPLSFVSTKEKKQL